MNTDSFWQLLAEAGLRAAARSTGAQRTQEAGCHLGRHRGAHRCEGGLQQPGRRELESVLIGRPAQAACDHVRRHRTQLSVLQLPAQHGGRTRVPAATSLLADGLIDERLDQAPHCRLLREATNHGL